MARTLKEQQDAGIILFWCLFLALLVVVFFAKPVKAEDFDPVMYSDAIFHAEGGAKAQYLYGIRSVPYADISKARQKGSANMYSHNPSRAAKMAESGSSRRFSSIPSRIVFPGGKCQRSAWT